MASDAEAARRYYAGVWGRLLHLPRRDGESLHEALKARLGDLLSVTVEN